MTTAILLGIPQGYINEIKSGVSRHAGRVGDWNLQFIPSRNRWPSFFESEIKQALEFAQRARGAHVLGYSTEKNRQEIARQIRPFFRFRWSDVVMLRKVGANTDEYLEHLFSVELAEESHWIDSVKPRALKSPILLPECSFTCRVDTAQMWRHVEAFGRGNIDSAVTAVDRFESVHLRKVVPAENHPSKYLWVDSKDRCFDHTQDRHGTAKFPRNWKYSYEIADGFHYDVRHLERRAFEIKDFDGYAHSVARESYINIDPHGSAREAARS